MRLRRQHPGIKRHGGFTLAELLIVIAIIGILFAMVLPALHDVAGASRLDAAANTVHSGLKMARQYALTRNQPTYFVFNEGQTDTTLAYRAYAVFTINTHTNPVTQSCGYFLTGWEPLPSGIVFDDQAGQDGSLNVFHTTGDAWNGAISKNNRLKIQGSTFVVLGFTPTGEAGSKTHWIYLAEGFRTDSGELVHTAPQGKRIQFDITGKSRITDILYDESVNDVELAD